MPTLFPIKKIERERAVFEVFEYAADATLNCRVVGEPDLLDGCR